MGLEISASGFTTAIRREDFRANNIANLNTPGYRAKDAAPVALANGGVVEAPEGAITGGSIGGMLRFRTESLDTAQSAIGRLSLVIGQTFNDQHKLGIDLIWFGVVMTIVMDARRFAAAIPSQGAPLDRDSFQNVFDSCWRARRFRHAWRMLRAAAVLRRGEAVVQQGDGHLSAAGTLGINNPLTIRRPAKCGFAAIEEPIPPR